jgi:ribonuclease BN (tRNA processing enzyme)
MDVRLTVIGSSPAHPNPGSAHSGYLVESEGCGRLLLDCGPGVLSRLRAQRLLPIDAIAVTHFHLDHWGDLVPWAWFRLSGALSPGRAAGAKPELWIPPGGRSDLHAYAQRWGTPGMFDAAFAVREYETASSFAATGFAVEPYSVEHYGFAAFGFRVRDPAGRTLGYSGDSAPCEALRGIATQTDVFLCEATLGRGGDDAIPRGHLAADEALAFGDGRVVLTHRPVELALPSGSVRAADGMVIDV